MLYQRKSLVAGVLSLGAIGSMAQKAPNIVFIMSDDHAAQAISSYDSHLIQTPNIDRIANEGVRFTNCFCTNAISGPSRATILTGNYNHINGQYNNSIAFDTSQVSLPKILQQNGYNTAIVGKWHLRTQPSGFDYWNILPGQGAYYNPDFICQGEQVRKEGYVTDLITEDAIKWMKDQDDEKPFFLMVHHKAPHRNWMPALDQIAAFRDSVFSIPDNYHQDNSFNPVWEQQELGIDKDMQIAYDLKIIHPDSVHTLEARYMGLARMNDAERREWMELYRDRYFQYQESKRDHATNHAEDKLQWYLQDYLACINSVDQGVGDILDYLEESGLDKNTIVVYTSDQGFFLGEHGWFDKRFMYEESLRMPLLMKVPNLPNRGGVREQMLMNIDFAPTLLDYAGINKSETMQGVSFREQIMDPDIQGRESVYYHYFENPGPHNVPRHYGVRTEDYKLIRFYGAIDRWEMYDLKADPKEMTSVYNDESYATVKNELLQLLEHNRELYNDTIDGIPQDYNTIQNKLKIKSQTLYNKPSKKYAGNSQDCLYDGLVENESPLVNKPFATWTGYRGNDLHAEWILEGEQYIDTLIIRTLDYERAWIFAPEIIKVKVNDGKWFEVQVSGNNTLSSKRNSGGQLMEVSIPVQKVCDKLEIIVENRGTCPKGHPGEGQEAWLFIEEIRSK